MADDKRNYRDECGDYDGHNRNGEPCGRPAGWGTDFSDGKCKHHRGTNSDGSSHKDNDFGASHGLYAKSSTFYSEIATEEEQAMADEIYEDYLDRYQTLHGEPPTGHEAKLFAISCNLVKEYHGERWATQRPDHEDTGNVLVDAEQHFSDDGQQYFTHRESVVMRPLKKLSDDSRQWLKDMGLLDDPETQTARSLEDIGDALMENLKENYQ